LSILSVLRRTLAPSWTYEPEDSGSIIWKLLISPAGILTGEERNVETKQSTLFAVDVRAGRVLWRGLQLDEPWWFNCDRATEDTLFVQTFRRPDLPEPKGIIAIDIVTGVIRWHKPDVALLGTDGDRAFVVRQGFSQREYFALDIHTGEVIEEFGSEVPAIGERDEMRDSFFARPLKEWPPALAGRINSEDLRGPVEGVVHGLYQIYSFHIANAENDLLSSELLVLKNDRLTFRETIHAETPLPLPENFFVSHDFLLYVKEKRTLVGLDLRN